MRQYRTEPWFGNSYFCNLLKLTKYDFLVVNKPCCDIQHCSNKSVEKISGAPSRLQINTMSTGLTDDFYFYFIHYFILHPQVNSAHGFLLRHCQKTSEELFGDSRWRSRMLVYWEWCCVCVWGAGVVLVNRGMDLEDKGEFTNTIHPIKAQYSHTATSVTGIVTFQSHNLSLTEQHSYIPSFHFTCFAPTAHYLQVITFGHNWLGTQAPSNMAVGHIDHAWTFDALRKMNKPWVCPMNNRISGAPFAERLNCKLFCCSLKFF